mmetsp:Transcript_15140/g.23573  ORF Transcript_15140/g.23573 Transcript_15140/m.23573 type:complete len:99 (+) Transcript_15140:558-854(+)
MPTIYAVGKERKVLDRSALAGCDSPGIGGQVQISPAPTYHGRGSPSWAVKDAGLQVCSFLCLGLNPEQVVPSSFQPSIPSTLNPSAQTLRPAETQPPP